MDKDLSHLTDDLEEMDRNEEYFDDQKKLANEIHKQVNETNSLLSVSLQKHLNLGQIFQINQSEVFMSLEKISLHNLSNKHIEQSSTSQINFPLNFSFTLNDNEKILLRSKLEPLAPFGNIRSNTNLSRSLSLSVLDENGKELSIKTNEKSLVELIIPRDSNMIIPQMISQNVTDHNQSFYYKLIDLNKLRPHPRLTVSIHFQIRPENKSLAYLFIYQFDHSLRFNQLDGSQFFCPWSKFDLILIDVVSKK